MTTDGDFFDGPLDGFLGAVASDAATPGGGSAAMVSAVIGIGLVAMALRVTARSLVKKGGDAAKLDPLILACDRLGEEMRGHARADVVAFDGYMAALALPKGTEAEKAARKAALTHAADAATETPLNAAQSALEGLGIARKAADLSVKHILSDVGAGAHVLKGALDAVLLNVDVNLSSVDPDKAPAYETSRRHIANTAKGHHDVLVARIAHLMGS